ncbi:hypothetical protein TNCV_1294911 [Trichonephila clavipes]|nr:hypothetical protein TNCV_1294911 [Trichonephila clavipes]
MLSFGDVPRNFEPCSSDLETSELAPPLLTTTPHQRKDVKALVHHPLHGGSLGGTVFDLMIRPARPCFIALQVSRNPCVDNDPLEKIVGATPSEHNHVSKIQKKYIKFYPMNIEQEEGCAALPFETGIHFRRKTDFFPEEDTTLSYSGFEPEPTRLQAEGHSHHTGQKPH